MRKVKKQYRLKKCIFAVVTCMVVGLTAQGGSLGKTGIVYASETNEEELPNLDANGMLGRNSDIGLSLDESVIGTAGEAVTLSFTLQSANPEKIKLKDVFPVVDNTFPFETSKDAYKVEAAGNDGDKQKELSVSYNMVARTDLSSGYHSIRYIVEYTKDKGNGPEDFYVVKTINVYFHGLEENSESENGSSEDKGDVEDAGAGDAGGTGGSGNVAAPKLIITGYETSPKKVMAGDTFTITIHVQNTSKRTAIRNAKFLIGNEAGSILPTSGSSSIYVENIPAGQTGDLTIEMKTASDLAQKSYVLAVKGDFDDNQNNSYTYSENLYLPIYQEVKLSLSDISMTPEALGIGDMGTLMFTINNQGKAGVYNVNVAVKGDSVEAEEMYLGNIAASSSAYASLYVTGMSDNSDTGMVTVVISYEDSEGNVNKMEEEVPCYVGEDVSWEGDLGDEMEYEEEGSGFSFGKLLIGLFVALVIIGVIAGIVVFVVLRKKKLKAMLDDDLEDEDLEDENI